ncbi:hypothetical protein [Polynucleobacter sp. MWH-Aus1W21]|uniref:hypothetical protein n=1 Tax=Polynucleobacter sp. MWH-Aus1W21 TaxID=1855880 RepID=UPI001BFDE9BE|nr:hypothetical protein [Polynucleobacter sp. MWH-Aus1W21]QWD66585.1 hypothetical protein ICW03_01830 [Polynucleobacter sp. MWH-Aus1W21]
MSPVMRLIILSLSLALLFGCTSPRPSPKAYKPYRNLETYKNGEWILLTESNTKNWYYDPKTLDAEEGGIVHFSLFWAPRSGAKPTLIKGIDPTTIPLNSTESSTANEEKAEFSEEFNTGAVGPYKQTIHCPGLHQLSEIPENGACDISNLGGYNPPNLKPGDPECWVPIKPKTAMLVIAGRVCGRPLPLQKTKNYFLYQEGQLPVSTDKKMTQSAPNKTDSDRPSEAVFYEVFNNEYISLDSKNSVREMKVLSEPLAKKGGRTEDLVFKANCQSRTAAFYRPGAVNADLKPIGSPTSLTGVAFDRICGSHDNYMKQVKKFSY